MAGTPAHDFNTYQPSGSATKIAPGEAPTIDGALGDAVWAKAKPIEEFYQVDPVAGALPSERTVVRFLYDEDTLYVSVYAYDSEPDKIVASVRARDGNLGVDDAVRLYIDPDLSRRNAYYFEMNALGARLDGLVQNNTTFLKEWNTIWNGRAGRVADGYTLEIAIPFRDMSFDPMQSDWGLQIARNIRRRGERVHWSSVINTTTVTDISRAGTLTGIVGANQGLGLDIQTYGRMTYRHVWDDPKPDSFNFVMSGNAFYKITPSLTGTLTVDPDFANTPLDIRQVNTTRFALFQPETRDFFLQDAATFEFGGRGFSNNDNARPFFSRDIGLANGLPTSILGGGKLSGQFAGFGVGLLSVVTDGTGRTKDRQSLSVARITRPVLAESKIGFILTDGDPTGASKNRVAGVDFQYRASNFLPGKVLTSDFFYERSFSDVAGDDDTFGVAADFPNEPLDIPFRYKQVGRNFSPALGFANRTGIREYAGGARYRNRNLGWRWFDLQTTYSFITGLNNDLQSRENGVSTGINTANTDQFYIKAFNYFENVPKTFNLPRNVPVPGGRYTWTNINPHIETSNGRPYSAKLDVFCCSFYNGDYLKADLTVDYRPNALFQISPHYVYTYIKMPTGQVAIHLISTDVGVNFAPDMQLFIQLQYDNISQKFGLSTRYRWEYEPGQELFVSLGQSAVIPESRFEPQVMQASVRLGHTFRF